jgi:hypothetical protein
MPGTVRLHRVLHAPPERVYRAFLDADALKKVSVGTELNIVQSGIPEAIPVEACYLGWQESLALLGKLVEAEIPG